MECGTIQSLLTLFPHEGQIRGGSVRQIDALLGGVQEIIRLATTAYVRILDTAQIPRSHRELHRLTDVDGSERVTSRDFSGNEKVVLAHSTRTLSHVRRELALSINSDLCSFVISEAVDVKHLNSKTTEQRNPLHHVRDPFAKPILHRGELGHLSPVIGIHTKSFRVSELCWISATRVPLI